MKDHENEAAEAVAKGIGRAAGRAGWWLLKWFLIVNLAVLALWGAAELYLHLYPI